MAIWLGIRDAFAIKLEDEFPQKKPEKLAIGIINEANQYLHSWTLGQFCKHNQIRDPKRKVTLICKNEELYCQTKNFYSKKISISRIEVEHSLEETVQYLTNCEISDFQNEIPQFEMPDIRWSSDFVDICLLPFKNELMWQIFNKKSKKHYRLPLSKGAKWDEACDLRTRKLFEKIVYQENYAGRLGAVHFLKKFKINQVDITGKQLEPVHFSLQPITHESHFDKSIQVTTFTWSVVLVASGNGKSGNHAMILYEGLDEDNQYFMEYAEFTGFEVRTGRLKNPSQFKFSERTEIWLISKKNIIRMLRKIEKEKQKEIPFALTGEDSFLSKGQHNCCTWAREMLRIAGIELGTSPFGFLITATKDYTHGNLYYSLKKIFKK